MNPEEKSAIDSIEHGLYDPKAAQSEIEIHQTRARRNVDLPTSWGTEASSSPKIEEEKGLTFGTKFLLVSTILLFLALAFSAWRVFSLRNVVSAANIDVAVDIASFAEGGESTPLIVTLRNKNTAPLESATLTLLYKQGNGAQDEQEKVQIKRDVGLINAGEYKKQDFNVVLYGAEAESRDVVVKLEYKVKGSNAIFNKLVTSSVVLRTPPIAVTIDGPETLSVGQNGTYSFVVKNNSATTSLSSVLQIIMPNNFTVDTYEVKPLSRSTAWTIKPLAPGESETIKVVGSFSGKQGETGTFQAKIGSTGDAPSTIGIVYASQSTDVTLTTSPLNLTVNLFTERGSAEALRYGDRVTLTLSYSNNSLKALEDVSITLNLSGDAAIYNQINPTSGYYDSVKKTITWDKATFPDLAVLAPNAQGIVQVVLPIVSKGTNSPTLKTSLVGVATSVKAKDVVATVSKSWVVQGSATLTASTQYKNTSLGNTGPIPPRPNQETSYTARLSISAQNALSSGKVSFTLPAYVTWKGVTSNDAAISYDTRTRTVSWNVGQVQQGSSLFAEITLLVKPSQSHVNQAPPITSGILFEAEEEVSKARLKTTVSALTTALRSEMWPENPALVVDK